MATDTIGDAASDPAAATILVAVDSTQASVAAARAAAALWPGMNFVVAHASPSINIGSAAAAAAMTPGAPGVGAVPLSAIEPTADEVDDATMRARAVARDIATQAGLIGAIAVGLVGDASDAILEEAARRRAAVVVVGSHDHNWWTRLIAPSVADEVRREAELPVLIVPTVDHPEA